VNLKKRNVEYTCPSNKTDKNASDTIQHEKNISQAVCDMWLSLKEKFQIIISFVKL
jgi:hypothetical protein